MKGHLRGNISHLATHPRVLSSGEKCHHLSEVTQLSTKPILELTLQNHLFGDDDNEGLINLLLTLEGLGVGCPTISQVWDIQNYFYSWRFGGISDEVFIKIKEKY